jgi:hypothetical protein
MTTRTEYTEHTEHAEHTETATGTLKELLVGPLAELHDVVTARLDERNVRELLGEELSRLRGGGTGRSLVMLALLHDAVRVTQIALGSQPERHPAALAFAAPFLRTAVRTFAAKGLGMFGEYEVLGPREAGGFLREYAADDRPFGGANPETGWSGLQLGRNVALRFGEPAALDCYERLMGRLLSSLEGHGVTAGEGSPMQQLREFLADSIADIREALPDRAAEAARQRTEPDDCRRSFELREQAIAEREREVSERERQVSQRERDIEARARSVSAREAAVRRLEADLRRERVALTEPMERHESDRDSDPRQ